MRCWIAPYWIVLIALAGLPMAFAAAPAMAQTERETAALDALFAQLRVARDEASARTITDQIWIYWTTPAEPALASQMQQVMLLRQQADFVGVLALLDEIIAKHPDYAEAWNQRATIHYLLRNYQRSMADISKVLEFEPRHFGALVGRAVMYENLGQHELALADMVTALAIHPFLAERALFPELESLISI